MHVPGSSGHIAYLRHSKHANFVFVLCPVLFHGLLLCAYILGHHPPSYMLVRSPSVDLLSLD